MSEDTRNLPEQSPRVETGTVKFGDDWTGVFIRGDNAFGYAQSLRALVVRSHPSVDPITISIARGLLNLLESSVEE